MDRKRHFDKITPKQIVLVISIFLGLFQNIDLYSQVHWAIGTWKNPENNQHIKFTKDEHGQFNATLDWSSLPHHKNHINKTVITGAEISSPILLNEAKVYIVKYDIWLNAHIEKLDKNTISIAGKVGHFKKEVIWKRVN